jgi:hypothetical protein
MPRIITTLLLCLSLTLSITAATAQTTTGQRVGVVAVNAIIINVEDARAEQLAAELNSVLSSPQATPVAAYMAVKKIVDEQVRKGVARREWVSDPMSSVGPGAKAVLYEMSFPGPRLVNGKSKKRQLTYDVSGTSHGRRLVVSPSVEEATGRANKLTLTYSATALPNSAGVTRGPHEQRPDPVVTGDIVSETTVELPSSGGALLKFSNPDEPGRTTLLIIFGAS